MPAPHRSAPRQSPPRTPGPRRPIAVRATLSVLLLCSAVGAGAANLIRLPLPWAKGVQVAYQSEAVAEKSRGGTHQELRTREVLRIEVTESGDDGIVQVWHNEGPVVEGSGDAPNLARELATAQALARSVGAIPYQVQLNAKGEFQGLRNWEELAAAMRAVLLPALVDQARSRPEGAKLDAAVLRARIEPVLVRNSGRNATNASLGREAAIFNYFTGAGMTPGQAREYDDNVASPWSADLIPTHGSFEIAAVDEKAGTVSIRWHQEMDPDKAREVVIRNVEAATGKPIPAEARGTLPAGVKLSDRALVVLDRATGLPLSLDHVREVEFGGGSSRNQWTLQRIPEPAAAAAGGR